MPHRASFAALFAEPALFAALFRAQAALCALRLLWSKRSKLDLLGNTLDMDKGTWRNPAAGAEPPSARPPSAWALA